MKPKVIHINISDGGGGAERIAMQLMLHCQADSSMLVRHKKSDLPNVHSLPVSIQDRLTSIVNRLLSYFGVNLGIRQLLGFADRFHGSIRSLRNNKLIEDADIVHLHNIHGGYFDFHTLSWLADKKHIVWTLHDMWAFTGGEAYTFGDRSFELASDNPPMTSLYPIGKTLVDKRNYWKKQKRAVYRAIQERMTFIPVCRWLESDLKNAYVWPVGGKSVLIHNGVDVSVFKNHNRREWQKPRVLAFNSRNPFKGSALALEALNDLGDSIDSVVVGEASDLPNLFEVVESINTAENMAIVLNRVDILIFPSLAESFPLQVLEAMACGVCVIASDVGGVGEAIDAQTGFLFQKGDLGELVEKLRQAEANLNNTRGMGAAASGKVAAQFNLEKMVARYDALYSELTRDVNS